MVNKITGTYRQGSSGEEVKRIQEMLIAKEYDVGKAGADGVFGKDTLAAVQKYQKDNGLSVDGIVGKNTLESLYSTQTTKPSTSTKPTTPTTPSNSGGTETSTKTPATTTKPTSVFDPTNDPLIQEASSLLQQHLSNKVGDWTDPYKDKWMGYIEQYENRDPFSYDFNSDALYNQYKDQYIKQGRMAMMDTMGQAQAMTGGYGNSYAQTVGQQAYNQQLNQLNEIMPELYGMAYDRYKQEGQDMLDMYSLYKGMSEQDYNMHQDNLDNWYTELNYLTGNYNDAYSRSENYKEYILNLISTGYEPSQSELDAAGISKEQANAYKKAYTGDTGTGNPGNTDNKYKDIEIGSTAYNTINAEIKNVTTIAQLKSLVKKWIAMGYDPAVIDQLTADKAAELMPKPDPVLDTGSTRVGVSGGGSGVTFHATAW